MKRWVVVIAALCALASCKSRGTFTVDIDFGATCEGRDLSDQVRVYMVEGALCSTCECGACWDLCDDADCQVGCNGGLCDADDLQGGISLDPDRAGAYVVVYDYFFTDGDGSLRLGASACADVTLDKDGTDSDTLPVSGVCCYGDGFGPDAAPPSDAAP